MDLVTLSTLRIDAVVGILPAERQVAQPVILDVALGLPLDPVAQGGSLEQGVDYAAVEQELTALVRHGRFWLIESLALAAARWLLLPLAGRGRVEQVRVSVQKPQILGGRAVPGVVIERSAPVDLPVVEVDGARWTTLVDTGRDGAWRVDLDASCTASLGPEQGVHVASGSVNREGALVRAGFAAATLLVAGRRG